METSGPSGDDLGADMDLSMENSGSSIVTMEPFNIPNRRLHSRRNFKINNASKTEILPGVMECNAFEKYLVVKLEDERTMRDLDMFDVHDEILKCCGREPKMSYQGDGTLLIESSSPEESRKLQSLSSIKGIQAHCLPHRTLNQVKGVIHSRELLRYTEERLQEALAKENVIKVQRMTKKVDGVVIPLPTLILTFNLIKLPSVIKAAWLRIQVRPYIPAPRRWYHCQRFGHVLTSCRSKLKGLTGICFNCGQAAHGECNRSPYCVNCGGNHPTIYKKCERFIIEKEIQSLRTRERISFSEAKDKVLAQYIRPGVSYSSVLTTSKQHFNDSRKELGSDKKDSDTPKQDALISEGRMRENEKIIENTSDKARSMTKRQRSSDDLIKPCSKVQIAGSSLVPSSVQGRSPPENIIPGEFFSNRISSIHMDTTAPSLHTIAAEIHAPPHSREQKGTLSSTNVEQSSEAVSSGGSVEPSEVRTIGGTQESSEMPSLGDLGLPSVMGESARLVSLADSGKSASRGGPVGIKSSNGASSQENQIGSPTNIDGKGKKETKNANMVENKNNKGNRQKSRITLNKNLPHNNQVDSKKKSGTGRTSVP